MYNWDVESQSCSSFDTEFRPSRETAKCKSATIHYKQYESFFFNFIFLVG